MSEEQHHRAVDLIHLLYAALVGLVTPGGGEVARELAESAMQEASEFLGLPPGNGS
ncbi:hypothetical protein SAMN05216345_11159 [Cupriavidus sp. YR651]|uniref:hypothetical protein n=1 Tax=Cupriavidus sp. YR651 TaxID=1855315 RepID=UPI00088E32DD|nr:hypothetical protein [Cupriavidus sp. YR651]SDD56450.1 hypothetical protein SAMN05216345_11159 [Cupriavidus sp. YR651]